MSQRRRRGIRFLLGLAALVVMPPGAAWADPIAVIPNTANMFRDTRGINNVGIGAGNAVQYGASIEGGSLGISIGAFHVSGVSDPPAPCGPLAVNPNFCAGAFGFNPGRLSGWTIRFTDGADTLDVPAPSLIGAENPVPFPSSVTVSAGLTPTTPTISWLIPGGFLPDGFRINIFDVDGPSLPNGTKNVIHSVAVPAASTSYTIPATLSAGGSLELGRSYSINFQIIDLRAQFTEAQFLATNNNAMILNRSNSWFAFQPLDASGPPEVHLPQMGNDPDPNDAFGAPYLFSIESVGPDSVTFIDPVVALGYDYAIGAGNPNFASVILPDVGDGVYDLIFDGIHHSVLAGQQFFFPPGGVAAFSVRGIEASAGLDPTNVVAFVTGLTFVGQGRFTGSMTPIVQFVPTVEDLCPCGSAWKNHGAYVSCVAHGTEDLVTKGLLTEAEKDALVSIAAQSNCGRKRK
jgi:hypothetical protein